MLKNLTLVAMAAVLMTGCNGTDSQHVEQSAKEEGKKLETSAKVETKKLEKSMSEGVNSTKIKAALTASSRLDASHVTVNTEKDTVYLRGSVPTADQKQLAARIASDTVGKEQHIVDELKVEAHPSDNDSPKEKSTPSSTATP
jgi:osmotically-inducible protein OsmY